jgi:hypothetical protein
MPSIFSYCKFKKVFGDKFLYPGSTNTSLKIHWVSKDASNINSKFQALMPTIFSYWKFN